MSDTISDFITIIRNGSMAGKATCVGRISKMHLSIARILKDEGFIRDFREARDQRGHKCIEIELKYVEEVPAITGIKRWSKSGRRLYYKYVEIPRVLGGLGISILTTSRGLMKDRDARHQKIGGELICTVW